MKSELAIPIRENGRVLGVINVESMYEFPFEEYEIKLIETLAMYAATALGRLEEKANIEQIIELKTKELIQADRFASLGKVTSMVAHDLSNPLQTIRNSTYFLDKDEDGHVARIIKAVDFAGQILEDIKTHTVDTPVKRVLTDLGEIIENSIEQVRVPDNIKIETVVDEELGPISIDPVKIRRMLVNLIKNAIEATTEGGKVRVIAGHHKGGVEIRVEDNGVGISQVIKDALFTQVITTKPIGTGLGLSFCKRAVEMHGGVIEIESAPDCGTVIKVFIPILPQSEPNAEQTQELFSN